MACYNMEAVLLEESQAGLVHPPMGRQEKETQSARANRLAAAEQKIQLLAKGEGQNVQVTGPLAETQEA